MSTETGREVFTRQGTELLKLGTRLGQQFDDAVNDIFLCRGRVILFGIGKSGLVGQKIAATLASTGTPSFSIHPTDAYHGDLGMVKDGDIAVLISYSGETDEIIRLIPSFQRLGVEVIGITGNPESSLGKNAHVVLDVSVSRETCPNNLAPTTSTTATMVMGDALASALMELRGFTSQQFAMYHPGGTLGKKLLTRVKDVMTTRVPVNHPNDSFRQVITTMTEGGLGLSVITNGGNILGLITDGDLRRALSRHSDIDEVSAGEIMSLDPTRVQEDDMYADAEQLMYSLRITALVVTDKHGVLTGVIKLQDGKLMAKDGL